MISRLLLLDYTIIILLLIEKVDIAERKGWMCVLFAAELIYLLHCTTLFSLDVLVGTYNITTSDETTTMGCSTS